MLHLWLPSYNLVQKSVEYVNLYPKAPCTVFLYAEKMMTSTMKLGSEY